MKSELRNNFSHLDTLTNCIKEELLEVSNLKLRNIMLVYRMVLSQFVCCKDTDTVIQCL